MSKGYRSRISLMTCLAAIIASEPAMARSLEPAANGEGQSSTVPPLPPTATPATTTAPSAGESVSTSDNRVGDIIVTAQRRSERLQNVPIAVTALDGAALRDGGVTNAVDLPKLVPGLTFTTQLGGLGLPRIRGVGISSSGPAVENPVALYIDGVYYASAAAALFDLPDVAQVSVLKGPQGTLFGRNATGGLLQVTTKTPSHDLHIDALGSFGNHTAYGGDLYVTDGLTSTVAASITLHLDDQDGGFGIDVPTGKQIQTHKSFAARGKLLFEPDADTKFTLSADYSKRHGSEFALRNLGYEFILGQRDAGGPRDIVAGTLPDNYNRDYGVSLTGEHDFGGVRLVSISAYRNTYQSVYYDADAGPVEFIDQLQVNTHRQLSQELQLVSENSGPFKWQVGTFYYRATDRFDPLSTVTFFGVRAQHDIYVKEDTSSYAVFGQGTYTLNPTTNFTAGLRFTYDDRTHLNSDSQLTPRTQDFNKLTWRFALDHKFTPDILGYLSYNRGFKSGTFDPLATPDKAIVKPETLDAYELGVKSEYLDHRVRLNVAVFYYDYKNIQVSQFANSAQIPYNASGATSYGLDADLLARVTTAFTINAGVSYVHGRYKSFKNAFRTTPNPPCTGFGCGGNVVTLDDDATGNKLQNTPDYTFNIGGSYTVPLASGGITASTNYFYNGGYFSEPENRLKQPSYGVWDASLGWKNSRYEVRAFAKNLLDKVYAAQLAALESGDLRVAAPGRTYGISIGFHY